MNRSRDKLFHFLRTLFLPLLLLLSLAGTGCSGGSPRLSRSFVSERLEAHGIVLYYPSSWFVSQDDYFNFKATGFAPNRLPAFLEYRGLQHEIKDEENRDLYARGWYEAIQKNYPDWKYDLKEKVTDEGGPAYTFEGTYRVATDTFRKIGKLRFRANRIHAIYYTGSDVEFPEVRQLFQRMDEKLRFFPPVENTETETDS